MDTIVSALSSMISAVVTKTTVAPLERIKLLKQSQLYYGQKNYSGLFQSCKFIYKNEGAVGFFRGNYSNLVRIVPAYMIKFPLNDFYKQKLGVNKDTPFKQLAGGIFAGFTQISITYPLDTIRTRMSLDHHMTSNYNNYLTCARNIIKQEGFKAFYKGFPISGVSYPLYVGLQFFAYEKLKEEGPPIFENTMVAGASAGLFAQSIMFPGDTIKRNLQINGIDNTASRYNNPIDCIIQMYRTYGIRAFYTGYGINLIKAVPEVSLQFTVYDIVKSLLVPYI